MEVVTAGQLQVVMVQLQEPAINLVVVAVVLGMPPQVKVEMVWRLS